LTPRDIIVYINELVSLKQIWKNEIPLLPIAIYALKKNEILKDPVRSILSGNYLNTLKNIVENTVEFQGYIAAITYGIDKNISVQIPLMQYIQNSLKGEPEHDLNKYSDHKHFNQIFDNEIRNIDITFLDKAIACLSDLKPIDNKEMIRHWNYFTKLKTEQKFERMAFENTHKALLLNADAESKKKLLEYLCNNLREFEKFDGAAFFNAMSSIENFILDNDLKSICLSEYISEKKVPPLHFAKYVNQAQEKYKEYDLICDNELLNQFCINPIRESKVIDMDFLKYISDDPIYSFEKLEEVIEETISGPVEKADDFLKIFKTYRLISKVKPLKKQLTSSQIKLLLNTIANKDSESYYDLVAMGLANQSVNTPFKEGLDSKIAERIEYYNDYGSLLISSVNWSSELLGKSLKILTNKSFGVSRMNILEVLPIFDEIKDTIDVDESILLNRLNGWYTTAKKEINTNNIEEIIHNSNLYKYFCESYNELSKYIINVAIEKLKTMLPEELHEQWNDSEDYWLNCASILIQEKKMITLPDNLIELCKIIILEVSEDSDLIPEKDSTMDVIINKASKTKLQPTLKRICDDYCNRVKDINPDLFDYFVTKFNFINKMKSRYDAITRNILTEIIKDQNCLEIILNDSNNYATIINKAGDDAEDLKSKVAKQISDGNKSKELIQFAQMIGIQTEQKDIKED